MPCRAGRPGTPEPGSTKARDRPAGRDQWARSAGGGFASPSRVGEGRDEAIALAGDGGDEARVAVVVLELDAQAPDVAVDDVALGHEVHAPDRVENLLAVDDAPTATREEVEQALLDAGE